jgi:uncharacterized protein
MEFFLCVMGMVLIVEGIPYFGFPDKMKELMSFIQEQDDWMLRLMGAFLIVSGLIVVYVARKGLGLV